MKKFFAIFLAILLILSMTMTASAAKKIKISVPDSSTSYICMAAKEFAKRASEYSEDSLEFEVVPDGVLYEGDTAYGIQQLSNGSLPIVILSSAIYTNFMPSFNVISVPYMFDDQEQLLEYLNSDIGKELFNRVNLMGITVAGKWTRSFREITNSKHPIRNPSDLQGIVLRVPNNALYVEFFTACGAVTTPMDFSGVYNALQREYLDGQENPLDVPYSSKFYEVQKYISFTNHMADAWVVGINTKFFKKLSKKEQFAIERAGDEVQEWNVKMME
ncbi:MAG: DctP family TRAP transporter solute-binding subunit [Synergistaceae bacterium]|nr:DctP family TRAP transporter solute-binding subunit [Synergistaceae bacterium]